MSTQLSETTAIRVSETQAQNYYQGGTFTLGPGPFSDLSFSAQDDDTDFASFGAQYAESTGAGRQTGTLSDGDGAPVESGLASLRDVLTLTDPATGQTVTVGRVSLSQDTGGGAGAEVADVYIFDGPIDPTVTYNVTHIDYTPGSSPEASYGYTTFEDGGVVCFATGTLIATANGARPVERIGPGDLVQTVDDGLQPVLWAGRRHVDQATLAARPGLRPIRIAPRVLGNDRPLLVSPQHRLLLGDQLISARQLTQMPGVAALVARGKRGVTYHHLLLEDHHVLLAEGAGAESLYLGPVAQTILAPTLDVAPDLLTASRRLCRPLMRIERGQGRVPCAA